MHHKLYEIFSNTRAMERVEMNQKCTERPISNQHQSTKYILSKFLRTVTENHYGINLEFVASFNKLK